MGPKQSGNVLFLILIAVALFAALSYAVTKSTNAGGQKPDKEKAALCVSQINGELAALDTAVMRIKAAGYQDHQIDVYSKLNRRRNGGYMDDTSNAACGDSGCRLFSDKGGSFSPVPLDQKCGPQSEIGAVNGNPLPGSIQFRAFQVANVGSPDRMSFGVVVGGVSRAVCDLFSTQQGLGNYGGNMPEKNATVAYSGTLSAFPAVTGSDKFTNFMFTGISLAGRKDFCGTVDYAFDTYMIYHVITAR